MYVSVNTDCMIMCVTMVKRQPETELLCNTDQHDVSLQRKAGRSALSPVSRAPYLLLLFPILSLHSPSFLLTFLPSLLLLCLSLLSTFPSTFHILCPFLSSSPPPVSPLSFLSNHSFSHPPSPLLSLCSASRCPHVMALFVSENNS